MTQDNANKRTVKYSVETDTKLQKLADGAGCSKRDYFMLMVEYFYRTKKDPKDINDEQLKEHLAKITTPISGSSGRKKKKSLYR